MVSGAWVSAGAVTVHVRSAGEASSLPASSTLRTLTVWAPRARSETDRGLSHTVHSPASTWHWNVTGPPR